MVEPSITVVSLAYSDTRSSEECSKGAGLKPEQLEVVETIVKGRDLFAVLPTGYGKSLSLAAFPATRTSVSSTRSYVIKAVGAAAARAAVVAALFCFPLNIHYHFWRRGRGHESANSKPNYCAIGAQANISHN